MTKEDDSDINLEVVYDFGSVFGQLCFYELDNLFEELDESIYSYASSKS